MSGCGKLAFDVERLRPEVVNKRKIGYKMSEIKQIFAENGIHLYPLKKSVMVQLARDYMEGKRVPTEYLMRKSEEAVLMYKGEEVRVDKIAFEKLILKRKRKLERGCVTDSSSDDDSSSELELSPKCESA